MSLKDKIIKDRNKLIKKEFILSKMRKFIINESEKSDLLNKFLEETKSGITKKIYSYLKQNGFKRVFYADEGFELREGYGDIYLITNKVNNKRYIGQCAHFYKHKNNLRPGGCNERFRLHVNEAKSFQRKLINKQKVKNGTCFLLNRAIIKYGHENFQVESILVCKKQYLDFFESQKIKEFNTHCDNNEGYNMTNGGTGVQNYVISEKKFHSKKYKLFKSDPKKHREQWVDKISKTNKVRKRSISDETLYEILKLKDSKYKVQEVCMKFKTKSGKFLDRNLVSQIWSGKVKPLGSLKFEKYDYYVNLKRRRVFSNMFSDEYILKVLKYKFDGKTEIEISKLMEKYNKSTNVDRITKILSGEIKPRLDEGNKYSKLIDDIKNIKKSKKRKRSKHHSVEDINFVLKKLEEGFSRTEVKDFLMKERGKNIGLNTISRMINGKYDFGEQANKYEKQLKRIKNNRPVNSSKTKNLKYFDNEHVKFACKLKNEGNSYSQILDKFNDKYSKTVGKTLRKTTLKNMLNGSYLK